MNDLWRFDATEMSRLIRQRDVSCREVVNSVLERTEHVNPAINAVVARYDAEALVEAEQADRVVGERGPLHGVPITVKINIDVASKATDNGAPAFRELIAPADNPVVANYRRAGAIIVGRTNAPAFSMRWFTDNALHGRTLNPRDPDLTVGGSSGGAAAAVAVGLGPIALGNDIGGSIRYPAYCCGVLGLRPSYGRVPSLNETSRIGDTLSSQLLAVQGPLARSVRDLRLALSVMAVRDIRDSRSSHDVVRSATKTDKRAALVVPARSDPRVVTAITSAGGLLQQAGYHVDIVAAPDLAEAAALWPDIALPDVIAQIEPLADRHGDEAIRLAMRLWREVWPGLDAGATLRALARRTALLRVWQDFLDQWTVAILPVSLVPPYAVADEPTDVESMRRLITAQGPQLAVAVLGLPALAMPIGFQGRRPMGVQIIAALGREDRCLDAAEMIERASESIAPIDPEKRPVQAE